MKLPVPPGILVSGGAALAGIAFGFVLFFLLAICGLIPW